MFLSLALLAVLVRIQVAASIPVLTADVAHAISFERSNAKSQTDASGGLGQSSFGSKQWLLRGAISQFNPADVSAHAGHTVFIPTEVHLTQADWKQLVSLPVNGVVAATSPFDTHNELLLQHQLSRATVSIPVYFLPQDGVAAEKLKKMFATLEVSEYAAVSIGNSVREVTSAANASFTGINIYASLKVKPKEASADTPRLLITASFDTLGVAPASLTAGGASAAVAAVDLWWRFNAEAAVNADKNAGVNVNAAPLNPYSVSFLLGNTARFNYAGTRWWLSNQQEEDLDRYALVLCLDELLTSDRSDNTFGEDVDGESTDGKQSADDSSRLYMHVHDSFHNDPYYSQVKELAEATAIKQGIHLTILVAKTNYHHYDLHFEHEVLAHRQVHAVTISSTRRYRSDQLFRAARYPLSTFPNTTKNDTDVAKQLGRRVDFVYAFAKALLRLPEHGATTTNNRLWVGNDAYMLGMLRHAAVSHRSPVANGGADQLKFAKSLERHMQNRLVMPSSPLGRRALSSSVSLSTYRLKPPGIVLFGPYEDVAHVSVVKRKSMELLVLLAAVVAVGIFAVLEFGFTRTIRVLMNCEGELETASSGSS